MSFNSVSRSLAKSNTSVICGLREGHPVCGAFTGLCLVIAKFHYTDPTGPARTFFAAKLRWVRAGRRQSPCGSGRVRVMEFSSKDIDIRIISYLIIAGYFLWANRKQGFKRNLCVRFFICLSLLLSLPNLVTCGYKLRLQTVSHHLENT